MARHSVTPTQNTDAMSISTSLCETKSESKFQTVSVEDIRVLHENYRNADTQNNQNNHQHHNNDNADIRQIRMVGDLNDVNLNLLRIMAHIVSQQ
jgi:hypothetical protein